jgi:hypothetical protein
LLVGRDKPHADSPAALCSWTGKKSTDVRLSQLFFLL